MRQCTEVLPISGASATKRTLRTSSTCESGRYDLTSGSCIYYMIGAFEESGALLGYTYFRPFHPARRAPKIRNCRVRSIVTCRPRFIPKTGGGEITLDSEQGGGSSPSFKEQSCKERLSVSQERRVGAFQGNLRAGLEDLSKNLNILVDFLEWSSSIGHRTWYLSRGLDIFL